MTPEQRQALADLLIEWEDAFKQGRDTPADVLCKAHPELAETLARRIAALKRLAWLDDRLENDDGEPGDDAPEDCRHAKILAGRYRLDQRIATGGFAEVWQAYDEELQRIIAVKIPRRSVVGSSESFLAEARRVARLKHPAILPVYDVGLDGDDCFFVSEYVEGGSLADRLVEGAVSTDQACLWIASIADALDHAHASGVVHRDVKPANILIDAHGRALLADFGIAQSSVKTGELAPSIGTLRYMAPEQLDGRAVDPLSDIYSVAVVLHEVISGKPPYSSDDPNSLRREIGSGAKVSRDIPRRLVPVLRKALRKDPGDRFASAAQFASTLRGASRPPAWLTPLGAVAAAGLLLGLFGWRSQPAPQAPAPSRRIAVAPANESPVHKAAPANESPVHKATPANESPVHKATPANESPVHEPAVVRHEMPYPLPPYTRREWRSQPPDPGKTYRFDAGSGWWDEYGPEGTLSFQFRQTRMTDEYIDLADAPRGVWLRLRADACEIYDSPDYQSTHVLAHGAWTTDSRSPYPPQLDVAVTIDSTRDTLEAFIQQLARLTGVPITIDVPALQLQGITKNQSFGLAVNEQPAGKVLEAILSEADPQGRLRAVLHAREDGMTAIDVTTAQALDSAARQR